MAEKDGILEIGIWIKRKEGPPRRAVYDLIRAKGVAEYCSKSDLVEDWGFYDAREDESQNLAFQGEDHKRSQRVKPSDL